MTPVSRVCPCGLTFAARAHAQKYHSLDCPVRKTKHYASSRHTRSVLGLTTRAETFSAKRSGKTYLRLLKDGSPEPYWRPKTRGDCAKVERPCGYIGCRMNLYADIAPTGSIKFNFPHREPWEMEASCALDEAERDGMTLEQVGMRMNLTRERVRQIESVALSKAHAATAEAEAS